MIELQGDALDHLLRFKLKTTGHPDNLHLRDGLAHVALRGAI
jgi:hypothetical protein